MKSPSDSTDSSGQQDPVKPMNTERRISWQSQYHFSHPSHPSQFQATDGQVVLRPTYYPEKPDMYGQQAAYRASPSTDPNAWQGGTQPHIGGVERFGGHDQSSPAQSVNSQYMDRTTNSVNSNGMSGAEAAAAAAMAAAARTAKSSTGYQKPPNAVPQPLNAMAGKPMPVPVQRGMPFHPNYANVQANVVPPNVPPPDGGMHNHSSAYQSSTPANRPMNAPQYPQWAPPPQSNSMDFRPGYQPGFESHSVPPSNERIPSYASDTMSGPMSNASSHDSEESRPKSMPSARSSSQKISALYEPDEPGRKEFIDRILRYWEEKELPLKHAPMMGGRTLDLFTLYQHVKKNGFFQEVTRSKEWSEISSAMGLGNTSATGFTLKKQYSKYLYGFECHFERGEPEPQEALGRIIEANRKKKQLAEQNQAKIAENSHHDGTNMMHHPQHPYSGHRPEYRPPHPTVNMGYSQPMMTNIQPGYPMPGHNHSVPHMPSAQYEQQQGYPAMNMGWQQYPPQRPPSQPNYPYRSNGLPQPHVNSTGQRHFVPQSNSLDQLPHLPSQPRFSQASIPNQQPPPQNVPPVSSSMPAPNVKSPNSHNVPSSEPLTSTDITQSQNTPPVSDNVNEKEVPNLIAVASSTQSQPTTPAISVPPVTVPSTSTAEQTDSSSEQITAIVPSSTVAASNSASTTLSITDKSNDQPATLSTVNQLTMQQPITPKQGQTSDITTNLAPPARSDFLTSHEQRRMTDSPAFKPGLPPINSPQIRGPPVRHYSHNSSNMAPGPYHPHRASDRPMVPGGMYQSQPPYHQGYSPYHGPNSQPNDTNYYGQKRLPASMDQYGPPNKMSRPDPVYMQYRDNYEMQRRRPHPQRNDAGPMPYRYPTYPPGVMHQQPSTGIRHHPPPPHHPNYTNSPRHMLSPIPRNNSPSVSINAHPAEASKPRPPHIPGPSPDSAAKFLQGLANVPPRPHSGIHHHMGSHVTAGSPYPAGSVEAVVPAFVKPRDKSGRDVGVTEAWQIIMSLKSGLLAEGTWALNALTILLHDNSTIGQIVLDQLPGLLHVVIEHYRFCLHQLFGVFDDCKSSRNANTSMAEFSDTEGEKTANDMLSKCTASTSSLSLGGKHHKYVFAPERLHNKFSRLPVKVVAETNKYPLLLDSLWDGEQKPSTSDYIPVYGFKDDPNSDFADAAKTSPEHSGVKVANDIPVELTFEDMLSIPSFIRCFAQEKVVSFDDDKNEKENDGDLMIFPQVKDHIAYQAASKTEETAVSDCQEKPTDASADAIPQQQCESEPTDSCPDDGSSHIQSCLGRFIWSCNVALLEEEAAGFPGNSGFKAPTGVNSWRILAQGLEYIFPKKPNHKEPELVLRTVCLSNLVRSLSCAVANHSELCRHQNFFKTLAGTLLLGHKHRVRHVKSWRDSDNISAPNAIIEDVKLSELEGYQKHLAKRLDSSPLALFSLSPKANEIKENRPQRNKKYGINSVENAVKTSNSACPSPVSDIGESKSDTEPEEKMECDESGTNHTCHDGHYSKCTQKAKMSFSSTVLCDTLHSQDDDNLYHDPWWWECVQQLREDSLVTLANLSTSLNLSYVWSDEVMVMILDACLHWAVCSSADARDPFPSSNPRTILSPQSLGIEILTKLSMKEANVDLILATRPYGRLEKLFKKLTILVGNRKDQALREFSIVLLSNLCSEETAGRSVALQTGAVSNLLSFLEECEETGLNHQRMFPAGQELNYGTISYMMQRCALTLLHLAKIEENRPLFLKHHLRLLSLSMSSLLGGVVQSQIAAVLYELSFDPSNR